MNSNDVKMIAKEMGADLIGVAPIERFTSLAPESNPLSIFPECNSVIVIGRRILRGALRGVEEGTNFGSTYGSFGHRWLEDNFLSQSTYDLTCWIEEQGHEAVPLFHYCEDGMPHGVSVEPSKPAPNVIVDVEFAAQAAGLTEMGLGDFMISKEYGPRQRLALILTDAKLDADPVREKTICGDCGACAAACPHGAINLNKKHEVGVPGATMEVAEVDFELCKNCRNGASFAPGRGSRPDRLAAACVRACVAQLEDTQKCANKFENPFRKRKPWAVDFQNRPLKSSGSDSTKLGCDKATHNS